MIALLIFEHLRPLTFNFPVPTEVRLFNSEPRK